MQITHSIVKFPPEKRIMEILQDRRKDHGIKLVIRRESDGQEPQDLLVVVEVVGILSVFNAKVYDRRRKQEIAPNIRELSVNFIGRCSTPGVLSKTDKTSVEVEFNFDRKKGTLGAKPLAEVA